MTAEPGTIPRRLVAQARRRGAKVALREKKYGIWQEVTWEQYAAQVRAVCLGLVRLGLERGDRVAIISGNRPAWLYIELAAQSAGAIPLGIFVDSLPDQVRRILEHSEARFVLAENQEQADKVLSVRDALPRLERIIVDDMRGLEDYGDAMVVGLAVVAEEGRALDTREGHRYEELLERGSPSDVALLGYTSGTTGAAKAAMLSHQNLLAMAAGVTEVDPLHESDEIFSFLPFAWVGEQLLSVAIALHVGATVSFPEEPETLREDLREIGPHVMIAPPRFWEAMCSEYQVKIDDAGFLKRAATRAALAIGARGWREGMAAPPQASPGARCTASPTSSRSGPCWTSSACRASGTRMRAAPRSAPRSSSSSAPSAST
jgi:long-chain acyl-CoA synthetase